MRPSLNHNYVTCMGITQKWLLGDVEVGVQIYINIFWRLSMGVLENEGMSRIVTNAKGVSRYVTYARGGSRFDQWEMQNPTPVIPSELSKSTFRPLLYILCELSSILPPNTVSTCHQYCCQHVNIPNEIFNNISKYITSET